MSALSHKPNSPVISSLLLLFLFIFALIYLAIHAIPVATLERNIASTFHTDRDPQIFEFKTLNFAEGSEDLKVSSKELHLLANMIKAAPDAEVIIEAWVENTGSESENLRISENRAMIIREELIGRSIDPNRIRGEGKGLKQSRTQVRVLIKHSPQNP